MNEKHCTDPGRQNASGEGGVNVDLAGGLETTYKKSASEAYHQFGTFTQRDSDVRTSFVGKIAPTMSSREIAVLVEKRHDNVIRTIETLAAADVIGLPQFEEVSNPGPGPRAVTQCRVGERDSYIIVAQLSPKFTARLVDRWCELESAVAASALPDFANPAAAARAWADAVDANQALQLDLVTAAPAIAFVERYVDSSGTKGFRQACKLLGIKETAFRTFLLEKKIMYRLADEWVPFAQHLDAGRFVVKTGTAEVNGHAFNSARFTPKGLEWVAGELAKYQLEKRTSRGHRAVQASTDAGQYEAAKTTWACNHPDATPEQYQAAMLAIAEACRA